MLPAIAAATTAIDALQALTASKNKKTATTGVTHKPTTPFDVPSATSASATSPTTTIQSSSKTSGTLSSGTMSAMLDAQSESSASTKRADALNSLFGKLDSDGSGSISKAEFEDKLGAGGTNTANADKVFGKLDADGDGSVSLKELAAALTKPKDKDKADDKDTATSSDPLLKALDGAKSTSTANAASSTATSSYNFIEQMLQRQSSAIAKSSASTLSISA